MKEESMTQKLTEKENEEFLKEAELDVPLMN